MPGRAGELAQQEDLGTTGTFRTALLHTRDVVSAARFYGDVFGWQLQDGAKPSFTLRGERVAGVRRTVADDNLWVPVRRSGRCRCVRRCSRERRRNARDSTIDPQDADRRAVITDPEGAVIGLCAPTTIRPLRSPKVLERSGGPRSWRTHPPFFKSSTVASSDGSSPNSRSNRIRSTLCGSAARSRLAGCCQSAPDGTALRDGRCCFRWTILTPRSAGSLTPAAPASSGRSTSREQDS